MSSLKHLTLPGRKHRNKGKGDHSMGSQTSSISQLNTSLQSPPTNPVSHSLSSGEIHIKFVEFSFFKSNHFVQLYQDHIPAVCWLHAHFVFKHARFIEKQPLLILSSINK
jgi:hypothetical protein